MLTKMSFEPWDCAQVAVVVHVLEVPRRQRRGDHQGRRDRQLPRRQRRALHLPCAIERSVELPDRQGELVVDLVPADDDRVADREVLAGCRARRPRTAPPPRARPARSSAAARARASAGRGGRGRRRSCRDRWRRRTRGPSRGTTGTPARAGAAARRRRCTSGCRSSPCLVPSQKNVGVLVAHRPDDLRRGRRSCARSSASSPRLELQHPEQHRGDHLVADRARRCGW